MFKKILIANRGEIACRVIKTARKMGIATVAVYSDADKDALHVEMADEAVNIGAPASSESYLVIDKILKAVKETGAEAVHPGYGFLSENAAFAVALEKEGIAFIGPNVRAIQVMGDKIESKKFASAANVSTVPGHLGIIQDAEEALKISGEIGYPVMIKASAGGGGKGMRIAWSADEVAEGFQSAVNEAKSSFGDDRVFVEKFITDPRHIEIQILADGTDAIYLGERECSIQRRNQKVIEEAPSPFLDEATRKKMGEQAVSLAKAVDYCSAGTVEFIVDKEHNFYFLEMNTRLQVEHPVTELITGIDLVEQMIRVAAGEKLTIAQKDVKLNGWAIETRIYAEDPYRGFLPSTGRLVRYQPPEELTTSDGITVRNDTGVYEGGEISIYYDPMIAKLCTHAETREKAVEAMSVALDSFYIEGIQHNIPFLGAIMEHERFRSGNLTTGFIAEEFPDGFEGVAVTPERADKLVLVATFMNEIHALRAIQISDQLPNRPRTVPEEWVVALDREHAVSVRTEPDDDWLIVILLDDDGNERSRHSVSSEWRPGDAIFDGIVDGEQLTVLVERATGLQGYNLSYRGSKINAAVRTHNAHELVQYMPEKVAPDTSQFLLCPMPGLVVSINVEVGDEVKVGQALAVVEAMKMENILRAERDGVIAKVEAAAGDSLQVDQVIIEFE
ncbi:MAG: acetyl/propionyl-CoA carboxylase subunit alpha [Rhodobiaceae bacterium]|nr:MAG: acetyl/propionyl-CoA carboxylase subunit alpha [Rhodobiaceae bacterium]